MSDFNRKILISTPFSSDQLLITVRDEKGQIIKTITSWDDQYQLTLRDLPAGIYSIIVEKGTIKKIKKVRLR